MRKYQFTPIILPVILLNIPVFSITSCGLGTTKIGDIVGHPRGYTGKEVTIAGEVTETFTLIV